MPSPTHRRRCGSPEWISRPFATRRKSQLYEGTISTVSPCQLGWSLFRGPIRHPCGELTGIWGAPILEFWGLRSEGDCGRGKSCHFECGADADWEIYGRAGAVVGDGIGRESGGGGGAPGGD